MSMVKRLTLRAFVIGHAFARLPIAKVLAVLSILASPIAAHAQAIDSYRRVIPTPAANAVPQYTIQIDSFDSLTGAIEFGYELPFSEKALGLARYASAGGYRYVLALGTFYTRAEAEEVLVGLCPEAQLEQCRVKALSELESVRGETRSAIDVAAVSTPSQTSELEPKPQQRVQIADEVSPAEPQRMAVADDAKIYTVQVAAMYTEADARRVSDKIPSSFGRAEIVPTYSGKGNPIKVVTVGRFAYRAEAQRVALAVCDELKLTGCWVVPLAMLSQRADQSLDSEAEKASASADILTGASVQQTDEVLIREPIPRYPNDNNNLVYTVQLAAMRGEKDARDIAERVPLDFGEAEIVPVYTLAGDVIQSVIVGRFAFKDEGAAFAKSLCDEIALKGCWVKPLAIVDETRAAAR